LIRVKPSLVLDIALHRSPSLEGGNVLVDWPNLRFAVGSFDTWPQLRNALDDLRLRGVVLDSFNCLALRRVFAGKTIIGPSQQPVLIETLAFPDSRELLGCTSGPLADCLADRLRSGAATLKDALALSLVPRHAAAFQDGVESGKILKWIRVANADEERQACLCLLATSSGSIGVHDLVVPSGTGTGGS
jgi:hypothetical protein